MSAALIVGLGLSLGSCGPDSAPAAADTSLEGINAISDQRTLENCNAIPFEDMADLCRRQVAELASADLDAAGVQQACLAIQDEHWQRVCWYECAMRWRSGPPDPVPFGWCGQSHLPSWCVNHVLTARRAPDGIHSSADGGATLIGLIEAELSHVAEALGTSLPPAPLSTGDPTRDATRARENDSLQRRVSVSAATLYSMGVYHYWWSQLYIGSGRADPAAAQLAPPSQRPAARTAFVREAVRLSSASGTSAADIPTRVVQLWQSVEPALLGAPSDELLGMVAGPGVPGLPDDHPIHEILTIPSSPADEILVLAMRSMQADLQVSFADFGGWLNHRDAYVRCWAALLMVLTSSESGRGCDDVRQLALSQTYPHTKAILERVECSAPQGG